MSALSWAGRASAGHVQDAARTGRGLVLRVVAELLRGRPENKRRRGKHREKSKECGFAGGSGAYGSPKKKARFDKISSRDGAMICDEREW